MSIKIDSPIIRSETNYFSLIIFVSVTVFLAACSGGKPEQHMKADVVPVTADKAVQKNVPVQISAIGTVEAYSTVGIKAQTGGELTQVSFKEGQDVSKGGLLFTIDTRPYEAALRQAEAILARDSVQIENARLQLKYCSIYAPITGRTGSLIVNQGNLIKANADNPMVVINQIQPIYVSFSIPERYLPEIKKYKLLGRAKVEAALSKDDDHPAEGLLTFIDNAVDRTTGTIRLKATFANKEKQLWPGQYVNVVMTLAAQPNAIVVPSKAVQTGQSGQYVFVVKSDLTVEYRNI